MTEGDMATLVQQLLEVTVRQIGADQASLMLLDERTNELYIAGSIGPPADAADAVRIPVEPGLAGPALPEGNPRLEDGKMSQEPSWQALVWQPNDVATTYTPLRTGKRTVGVLSLNR
jgi:hypothetical protein